MVEIEITGQKLVVYVKGMDRVWALKNKVEIPLEHVQSVETYASYEARGGQAGKPGWRVPGTYWPGVIKAGSYYNGAWSFWDVHSREKAIVLNLIEEHYETVVVEVENPDLEIAGILNALRTPR